MRRTFSSFWLVLPFAVFSGAACGGSAFDGTPATGTGVGGTGAGTGGTATYAGAAGRSAGGSLGVGGEPSTGGSVSSGGTGNVAGTSGSDGGAGNAGAGGAVDITACVSNTDCEVVPAGCCSCGTGPVSNYTAINSNYDAQYGQRCGDIACGACPPTVFDPNAPTLYYVATCRVGRCAVVDLRTTDITACQSASDCSLRGDTTCCPGCGGTPVALNTKNEPELSALVCGGAPSACAGPACTPFFSDYSVTCSDRRCGVALSPCSSAHPCPL